MGHGELIAWPRRLGKWLDALQVSMYRFALVNLHEVLSVSLHLGSLF